MMFNNFGWKAIAPLLLLTACRVDNNLAPADTLFRGFVAPEHFPPPHYTFANNAVTEKGFELGRKLFYDPKLSIDNTVSCGTCHGQVHAFADHSLPLSTGINGAIGKRNTPGLANIAWMPNFMWDGGINHIEVMPVDPITNPIEMGETMAGVVTKLQNDPAYPALFKEAFGSDGVTDQRVLLALAQFMGMMVSADSKYDRYVTGRSTFTASETQGLQLFQQHCASCHQEPLFTDFSFRNNGLDELHADSGRYRITQNPNDIGRFRVPSLRNVELTNPYMHDGRFHSLNDVLDHYTSGIHQSATLDPLLQQGIALTEAEKQNIVAFLRTLSDIGYIADQRFAEPLD